MKTIKHYLPILFVLFFVSLTFTNCDLLKSEDEKVKDALIGNFYEDDRTDEDGTKTKDLKGEFLNDGTFWQEATVELFDDETFETSGITVKIGGTYSIKENFIYYEYDKNSLKITPEIYDVFLSREKLIKSINEKNTPDKIVDYDAARIVYEDSDGKRRVMKKSY